MGVTGPVVVVEALEKRYGRPARAVEAVRGVSFEIGEGEIYALLGPNGAGKSTTINILATLSAPSAGRASICGYDVATEPDSVRAVIGCALQETGVDPVLTGRELLELHGRLYGLTAARARSRADELLELVGLTDAATRRNRSYSGGMRRRLDLALALVNAPSTVMLDEPTTGLDPASRRAIWGEIRRLSEQGVSILLSTQYLEEADLLADRIGIIDRGLLIAEDTPAGLKRRAAGQVIELQFEDSALASRAAEALGAMAGASDESVRIRAADGAALLPDLIAKLARLNISAGRVTISEPSLEDVFLQMTGEPVGGPTGEPGWERTGGPAGGSTGGPEGGPT